MRWRELRGSDGLMLLRSDGEATEARNSFREKLGLARPGETVIRFEQPDANAP